MDNNKTKKKRKTKNWIWQVYFILTFLIVFSHITYFFKQDSPINTYYQILMAFDISYLIPYCLNAMSVILNTLSLVLFYFFIYKNYFFSAQFSKYLFFCRLIFDLMGRSYEFKMVKSLNYQDSFSFWATIFMIAVLTIPSYVANYLYAFKRDN